MATRKELFVVARTDAVNLDEITRRVIAFAGAGADAILIDVIGDLGLIRTLKSQVNKPLMFNQIAGGKSPAYSLSELREAGVSLVNYSTPCLFPAQAAIGAAMKSLKEKDGLLPDMERGAVGIQECASLLNENLARMNRR